MRRLLFRSNLLRPRDLARLSVLAVLLGSLIAPSEVAARTEGMIGAVSGAQFSGAVVQVVGSQCTTGASEPKATIDWGDGQQSAATIKQGAEAHFVIEGQHTYAAPGHYQGKVTGAYACFHQAKAQFEAGFVAEVTQGRTTTTSSSSTSTESVTSTTTTTATTTPPAGPPPVRASFAVTSVTAGRAVLDATASAPPGSQPGRYAWSITGASQPDVVCQGSEPQLTVLTRAAMHTTVSLTSVEAGTEATTQARLPLNIPAPIASHSLVRPRGHDLARAAVTRSLALGHAVSPTFQLVGTCAAHGLPPSVPLRSQVSEVLAPAFRVSLGGAPPAGCQQDVQFGAADIEGCLNELPNVSEIPGGVTIGLGSLLCGTHRSEFSQFCIGALSSAASEVVSLAGGASSARVRREVSAAERIRGSSGSPRARAAFSPSPAMRREVSAALSGLSYPIYYATTPVRINGLDVDPQSGTPLVVIPAADMVVAVNAKVYLHGVLLAVVPALALHLPDLGGRMGELSLPRKVPIIGSLPFHGSIAIDLRKAGATLSNGDHCAYDCAAISVNAELPGVFSDGNGNGLSAAGVLTADDQQGLLLDSLEVKVPQADLGGIGVSNVDFRYLHGNESLHGAATLELGPTGDFSASVDFVHGHFNGAHVEWSAGDGPGVDLGGPIPIFLTRLGGGVTLEPPEIEANAAIAGGPNVLGCSLFGIEANLTMQFEPEFALDANGTGEMLCQSVASEYFHLDGGGHIGLGGSIHLHFLVFTVSGGVNFDVDVPQGHFQADGEVNACLELFGEHCLGAEMVVSDRGIGVCADLGFTHAGGGIQFPDHGIIFFDTCDIGKFRSLGFTTAARGRRAAASSFTVRRGQKVAVIGLVGRGGAPRATLKGPDGRTIATPAGGYVKDPNEVVIREEKETQETYFFINNPAPGPWTVTPEAGSAPIASIQQAGTLPDPAIHARVRATRGGREHLSYTLHALPGQQVTFSERQRSGAFRTIGRAHGSRGALSFVPSPDLGSSRSVVAMVSQDGRPREDVTVAHFHPARQRALPAPRGLRVRRHGASLVIAYKRVTGATGYVLSARLTDGRDVYLKLSARKRGAVIAAVPSNVGARLGLAALMPGQRVREGRHARLTLRRGPRPAPTVVRALRS